MRLNNTSLIRLALLVISVSFIAAYVASQYIDVRATVITPCFSCIGIIG